MLLLKLLFLPFKDWTVKPFNGYSFKRGLQGEIAEPDNKTSYCFNYTCNIQDLFLFLKKMIKTVLIPVSWKLNQIILAPFVTPWSAIQTNDYDKWIFCNLGKNN